MAQDGGIGMGSGDDNFDVYAATAGVEEGFFGEGVGDEVGAFDADIFAGGGDRQEHHHVHVQGAGGGGAFENMCRLVADGVKLGEVVIPGEHLAGGFEPFFDEGGLHLGDDRAFDAVVGIASMGGILRVLRPFVGNAGTADESEVAVDDEDFAMGAEVEVCPSGGIAEIERVIGGDLGTGGAELAEIILIVRAAINHPAVGSEPIDEDVDLDAGASTFSECVGELLADVAGPVEVGFYGDGFLG